MKASGQLALHILCGHPLPSVAAMDILVRTYPQSVQTEDDDGYLPLHCALDSQYQSLDAIKILLEIYPEGVSHRTKNGWLPLHIALASEHVNVEVIRHLLIVYPNGVLETVTELIPMLSLSPLQQRQYKELLVTSNNPSAFSIINLG